MFFRKTIIFQGTRGGSTFYGGGGVQLYLGGGGGQMHRNLSKLGFSMQGV